MSTKFPNGVQDVFKDGKTIRTLPNGVVKVTFADGRQETTYPDGKVRLKSLTVRLSIC
jgi:hypothetical protein